MGWLVPLECVALDRADPDTGVVSIKPSLAMELQRILVPELPSSAYRPPEGHLLREFARKYLYGGAPKIHRINLCTPDTFTPMPDTAPVTPLDDDDLHASWYRLHFDGPVFVVRNSLDSIVSWAAIKCKSADVWEMAVATEAPYRGRGFARSVVSHATRATLDAGKVPLYLHDIHNYSSARVCTALGYQPYGHELTCEVGRILPRHPLSNYV